MNLSQEKSNFKIVVCLTHRGRVWKRNYSCYFLLAPILVPQQNQEAWHRDDPSCTLQEGWEHKKWQATKEALR